MASKYDEIIKANDICIIFYEGIGSYAGNAIDKTYHPKGRLGARISVYFKGKKVFTTNYASTLPDSISQDIAKKFNGGSPIPCTIQGVFDVYTKMHMGKYKALELGKNNETIPVIRGGVMGSSAAINMHYRSLNDSANGSFVWSAGCLTILEKDIYALFEELGIRTFSGQYVGKLIIDRSNLSDELAEHYKKIYGNMFSEFSSYVKEEVKEVKQTIPLTPIVPIVPIDVKPVISTEPLVQVDVQVPNKSAEQIMGEKAINNLAMSGIISNPNVWKSKDLKNEPVTLWLFFEVASRLLKLILKK